MKKISLFVAAMAMMSMSMISCSSASTESKAQDETAEQTVIAPEEAQPAADAASEGAVIKLADDSKFTPNTKVSKFTVLDFNAVWCVPCKKLTPAFDKAAEAFGDKAEFYSVDVDNNPETAKAFGVRSVPTVVFMAPNGSTKTFIGLDPFIGGLPEGANADEMTDVILKNLTDLISQSL